MPDTLASFFLELNAAADGSAPEWIQLLPKGATITTVDGRGPYHVANAAELAAASLAAQGGKLLIDETHSTDLAAPEGRPAPARGWVVEVQSRPDGLYGRVDWTPAGKQLFADKAYRGISPALAVDGKGNVLAILRASLTNTPNLRGMAALHQEQSSMEKLLAALRAALGLAADASEDVVLNSVKELKSGTALQSALAPIAEAAGVAKDASATQIVTAVTAARAGVTTALQAQLAPIAKAAGLAATADAAAVLTAVTTLAAKGDTAIVSLQSELKTVTTELNALKAAGATERATAFVDGAIKEGRVGVKPLREHYITMHAADPARVEKEIKAMPILGPSGTTITPPENKDGKVELNAAQLAAANLLGIKPDDYRKTLEAEAAAKRGAAA